MNEYYRANFDYEYDLFKLPISQKKRLAILSRLEYLYFFLELDFPLIVHREYPQKYIDFVEDRSGKKLSIIDKSLLCEEDKIHNLWGNLKNIHLEQKLNSKRFSIQVEDSLQVNYSNRAVVEDYESFDNYLRSNPFDLIKQDLFLFSGLGQSELSIKGNLYKVKKKDFPFVLSRKLDRIFDLGISIKNNMIENISLNFVTKRGRYVGSLVFEDKKKLYNFLVVVFSISKKIIEEIEYEVGRIVSKVESDTGVSDFQIDAFAYKSNSDIRLYPLCEINYRRTMGMWASRYMRKNDLPFYMFSLTLGKMNQDFSNINILSPENSMFNHLEFINNSEFDAYRDFSKVNSL